VFQADEWSAYIMGGSWGREVIKYDFLQNTTQTLMEHPYCYNMLPIYDAATHSAIVFCDKGPANTGAFVWKYDVEGNRVTTLLEDFPRFSDQAGASWDGEDAYMYALFGGEIPYGGLLQYNHPSGNLSFIPVEDFPGTSSSPLRSAATVHVPHLNRLYLFGGSRTNQNPFFQDSIYYINLGCPKQQPTTPTPPTTTTEMPQPDLWDCTNKTDGFYPHPLGCELFIGCRFGEGSVYTCPDPYLFDPTLTTCNQPHLVDCQLTCEGKVDGLHPHPYDCALVISCDGGDSMDVFKCPPPLLFDPVMRICNFPDLVNCNV